MSDSDIIINSEPEDEEEEEDEDGTEWEVLMMIKELEKARDDPPLSVTHQSCDTAWEQAFDIAIAIVKRRGKEL